MTPVPEFHRPFPLDRIGAAGAEQLVIATEAECEALAHRLDVPAVPAFACRFRLSMTEPGRIVADGQLSGRLVRECVVSLEPFETAFEERFHVIFVPESRLSTELDVEAEDEIPYAGRAIDLGEAATEQLALTLDPYPRRPDLAAAGEEPEEAGVRESPFALLGRRHGHA